MNFEYYLADIDVLCEYLLNYTENNNCVDLEGLCNVRRRYVSYTKKNNCVDLNGLCNIRRRYRSLIDSIPYNWYFCKSLFYDEIDYIIYYGYLEYDAIYYNLLTLKQRLIASKECSTFNIDCEFENIRKIIIEEIKKSSFAINIAVAWLSDNSICEALLLKANDGISIKIIMIDCEQNRDSILTSAKNIDIIFLPKFGKYSKNIMHNKFSIFDNSTVITGSYNWTAGANYNYENIVVIINPELARDFIIQFNKLAQDVQNI